MLFGPTFFNSMHLDPLDQAEMIKAHGVSCLIFPCLTCPCLREEQQHDPVCPTCQGSGAFYPPEATFATTLLLQQESSKRDYFDPGTWTTGTILASVLPGIRLCERDKVRWVDIRDTFSDEVLIRGLNDQVRFAAGVELLVVADRDRVYRPGTDYVLLPPNTVAWIEGGQAPGFMSQYSIKYSAFPEFLVVDDSPRLRGEHRREQSSEVKLLRLDKLDRGA